MSAVHATLDELIRLRATARGLELGARHSQLAAESGGYLSIYRGRGLEFDEVRAYQAGDDARTIDWRVSARRGRIHTKLFREERERSVLILVDLHPGMYFGTRQQFKSVLAARISALIAWATVQAGDRIGGVVSSSDGSMVLPPMGRRTGALRLLHGIESLQPTQPGVLMQGRLGDSLGQLDRLTRPGSLIFILSDFLELGEKGELLIARLARHNDLLMGLIFDPVEGLPPPPGRYRMGTPEEQMELDTASEAVISGWKKNFLDHRERLTGISQRSRITLAAFSTADEPLLSLRSGLARHGRVT